MNKQVIIQRMKRVCQQLKCNPENLILGFGGAMVMYGLRETANDLDIQVSDAYFKYAKQFQVKTGQGTFGEMIRWDDGITLFKGIPDDGIPQETEVVDGIHCDSPRYLFHCYWKLFNHPNRPSDKRKKDGEAIEKLNDSFQHN